LDSLFDVFRAGFSLLLEPDKQDVDKERAEKKRKEEKQPTD
jgi:hypothetical protein